MVGRSLTGGLPWLTVSGFLTTWASFEHSFTFSTNLTSHGRVLMLLPRLVWNIYRVTILDLLASLLLLYFNVNKFFAQAGAERKVTFDNGPDGSVAEDCFFGMKAFSEGYSFNFIEGEMWEKSPFTIWDFLQQRKRWMQVRSYILKLPRTNI